MAIMTTEKSAPIRETRQKSITTYAEESEDTSADELALTPPTRKPSNKLSKAKKTKVGQTQTVSPSGVNSHRSESLKDTETNKASSDAISRQQRDVQELIQPHADDSALLTITSPGADDVQQAPIAETTEELTPDRSAGTTIQRDQSIVDENMMPKAKKTPAASARKRKPPAIKQLSQAAIKRKLEQIGGSDEDDDFALAYFTNPSAFNKPPVKQKRKASTKQKIAKPGGSDEDDDFDDQTASQKRSNKTTRRSPAKRVRYTKKWDPRLVVTDSKSPVVNARLKELLESEMAWALLSPEQQRELLPYLPTAPTAEMRATEESMVASVAADQPLPNIALQRLQNSEAFKSDIRQFQEELEAGKLDIAWIEDAMRASERRKRGDFDEWKVKERENHWEMADVDS